MTNAKITGIGAVTSVGFDAVTTCASIRAGICRPETLMEYQVLDREEQAPVGVTGHPITRVTRGFTGVGRWLQMAALALEDLCCSAKLPGPEITPFWSSTLCYVVTPVLDIDRFMMEPACASEETVTAGLLEPLDRRVASFFSLARSIVWCRGRIGVLEAVQFAAEHFAYGRCERVVVLAVDSLTDGTGLSWLAEQGRLKHDDNPVGLAPGEGAAAFMLEAPQAARARRAPLLGEVEAVASAGGAAPFEASETPPGEALAGAIQTALASSGTTLPYTGETITDLNGEQWRAAEYGHAQVRVAGSTWTSDAVELPAASVGDPGAAMTALQIVVACRELHRGYASGDHILLTASDEYGRVGAAVIGRGSTHARGAR